MRILLTILARAGSEGIPGKCTKIFKGKPLYLYTVEQAEDWDRGEIVISTDCEEILDSAPSYASIIKRPSLLCQSHTPKLDALRHAVKIMEVRHGQYDIIIDLDVTNPLRTPLDIEQAYHLFVARKNPVLLSVTRARRNPYFNQVRAYRDFITTPAGNEQSVVYRRQDAPDVYDLNCSIYIYDRDWLMFRENLTPIIPNATLYLMKDWQAFDLDTPVDWEIVKMLHSKYMKGKRDVGIA
jgi:CMP-N-acetylneuraminic acid synthetase